MTISLIGRGQHAAARAAAIRARSGCTLVEPPPALAKGDLTALEAVPEAAFSDLDVAFVTAPAAARYRLAEAATRQSTHVFLAWPPAPSIAECEALVDLAEEAGVEVGVSRPLRFHPLFEALPADWRAHLIVARQAVDSGTPTFWPPRCADAIDLCCALACSNSIQRIDAEAVPRHAAWPHALAFSLRFHSGTYAQIHLTRSQRATPDDGIYVAGADFQVEADWDGRAVYTHEAKYTYEGSNFIAAETHAFLDALAHRRLPPVSILDGLHTLRLVERLMERLR